MGRVIVELLVANYGDRLKATEGTLPADKVRQVRLQAIVDTGANLLVLPEKVGKQLGLPPTRGAVLRFADGRLEPRDVVEQAYAELEGRHGVFNAILEPNRDDALIGAILLESLDLVVDCITQKLHPRDPDRIIAEVE